jgi:hypothetical protein
MEQNQIERSTKLLEFENEFKVFNFGICGAIFHL